MAKTKTKPHSRAKSSSKPDSILHSTDAHVKSSSRRSIEELLTEAASLLEQSQPDLALPLAEEALNRLEAERLSKQEPTTDDLLQLAAQGKPTLPTTLTLAAEVHLALGDAHSARTRFEKAVTIDPDGALVSADPWLWLAQLCEQGGNKSIVFFEKGCDVLRNEIEVLQESMIENDQEGISILAERRSQLADALCGMTEVYMTDLSWETDAEQRCETLVTEAVTVCPEGLSAGVLQTLASVRISQQRVDEARAALKRSLAIWKDIPSEVEDEARPDFATRVSLSRLLMEVDCEVDALGVLEGLVKEDDQSVECWYLGGWCQVLMGDKPVTDQTKLLEQAKAWIDNCLRLYKVQEYEDDRLQEHALELKQKLNNELGIEGDDDAWEDEDEEDLDGEDLEIEDEMNGHARDEDVEMV